MASQSAQRKIEARLRTLDTSILELLELMDHPDKGTLEVNLFILKNCKTDIQKASDNIKEALRFLGHWEAKRGGRPFGFSPNRKYQRGRYG